MSEYRTEELKNNYEKILSQIQEAAKSANREPKDILLIPVSKTHPIETIRNSMDAGMKVFGESYAQELKEKFELLENSNIEQPEWHFIGHLQRNKVKYIAPFVHTIHAVDSLKLAKEINKQSTKHNRKISILLQINTSGEESKFGMEPSDLNSVFKEVLELKNIKLIGLMTITGLDASDQEREKEFQLLGELLKDVNSKFEIDLKELSMGMSGDFISAIKNGSTMVRVGTSIFGQRNYSK